MAVFHRILLGTLSGTMVHHRYQTNFMVNLVHALKVSLRRAFAPKDDVLDGSA